MKSFQRHRGNVIFILFCDLSFLSSATKDSKESEISSGAASVTVQIMEGL